MEAVDLTGIALHESLVLIIPVLLIVGFAMKQTPKCPDWLIVWAMLILGGVAGVVAIGSTLEGLSNGILAGGLAVTSHQVYKQTLGKSSPTK